MTLFFGFRDCSNIITAFHIKSTELNWRMHLSYDQDILVRGTNPKCVHWIRDSCLSYFWELLFMTARSAGICVAMARVPVGQAAQWGRVVWLTSWLAVLGSGAREKPRPAFRQRGVDWPRGPAQRRLPTAGCVEGGCSQEVKLQTLCNMDTPDTS